MLAAIHPDYTAAYLTLAGALGAGLIGLAGLLIRERSATRRLDRQLAHDRELVDVAELRTVLDEAAAMMFTALDKLAEVWVETDAWAGRHSADADKVAEARRTAFEALWPMEAMVARLAIRLRLDHPIVEHFRAFHRAANSSAKAVPIGERPAPGDGHTTWREAHPALRTSRQAFVEEAERRVGSGLGGTESEPAA